MKNEEAIKHIDNTLAEIKSKGLKSVNFLQWYKDTNYNSIKVNEVANFYNQPFRPELITEIFSGWYYNNVALTHSLSCGSDSNYFLISFDQFEPSNFACLISKMQIIKTEHWDEQFKLINVYPKTLDNFISDCSRAGIELHFKENIIKEWF